ncbi:FtsW/RodA/SpoVE family cell cycle protein [Jeotgalibacillus proteolyticus]|uniref:Probable peptidoglycan glycosyltransferase FtsW n=1 Tax=Jeotgalibacillus proteolyticus TaxID=2082395 RepID=A0A2S5GHV5_9BACL|nr:FtsW/RodA/SpoVE family cell cycle protein [Jeotgalibacillus proteolyticus]PPA72491.1 cell division protein FtsW [Jeotgalibacillus proteolyticus]
MLRRMFKSYDYSLLVTYLLLGIFGVVMVYSAGMVYAVEILDQPSDFFYRLQLRNLIIGFIGFSLMALIPYKLYREKFMMVLILIVMFTLLGAVQIFGANINNAQSWLQIGSFQLQPSEFAKLGIIVYLSAIYAKKYAYIDEFNRGVMPPLTILIVTCFMVALEPDFGTAAIIFCIGMSVIISSGMRLKSMLKLAAIGAAIVAFLSSLLFLFQKDGFDKIFSEERLGRIAAYTDPFAHISDNGWQLVGSYYAIGNGGLWGIGLGQSIQKLGYLPEPHTDFIMAIIAEELGIAGVGFVVIGLAYIVLRGITIGIKSRDRFGKMLAIGISSMIGIQTFINLGGMSGVIPITGVPLPFISYGGSSLILLSLAMGLLLNVSMFVKYEDRYRNAEQNPTSSVQTANYQAAASKQHRKTNRG